MIWFMLETYKTLYIMFTVTGENKLRFKEVQLKKSYQNNNVIVIKLTQFSTYQLSANIISYFGKINFFLEFVT